MADWTSNFVFEGTRNLTRPTRRAHCFNLQLDFTRPVCPLVSVLTVRLPEFRLEVVREFYKELELERTSGRLDYFLKTNVGLSALNQQL